MEEEEVAILEVWFLYTWLAEAMTVQHAINVNILDMAVLAVLIDGSPHLRADSLH